MTDNVNTQQETIQDGAAPMLGEPWVSSNLLGNLSPDYKPGPEEDFYVYVNRDWLLEDQIEEGLPQNRPMTLAAQRIVQDRCAELLAEGNAEERDVRSAQNYYALLRDWKLRDKVGIAPLDEKLARIDAISSLDELTALLTNPDPMIREDLLAVAAMGDITDGSKVISYVMFGVTNIHDDPADYANPSETAKLALKGRHDMFRFVADKTVIADRAEEIFQKNVEFQTEMATHLPTSADLDVPGARQALLKHVNRAELIEALGAYPTQGVLEAMGYGDVNEFGLFNAEASTVIASCYDEAHLEGMKAFLMADLIKSSTRILTKEIYDAADRITAEIMGTEYKNDEEEQRRDAFDSVFNALPTQVSKLYVSRYADDAMKAEIRDLCDQIVGVYKKMLQEEDWLSEQTRAFAIKKLDNMKFRVLYPDKWEDGSALDIRSAAEGETLWTAKIKAATFRADQARATVGKPVDMDLMSECIKTNCNYNASENAVNIFVGFLSDVTYRRDMTIEEKMGALGMIIGHEISHAFDTTGMMYDENGAMADWWTDEDGAAFAARAQKALDWYEKTYKPLGEAVEGIGMRSIGETIADLGSLSVAMTLARDIDGFDYDKFFRANAVVWRRQDNDYAFNYMLQTDEHPMDNLRVNLTLAQCDKFHETYGVKEGDKMYFAPEDRLRVW